MEIKRQEEPRKVWKTPELIDHGRVVDITAGWPKNKTFGGSDDVLVDGEPILGDVT